MKQHIRRKCPTTVFEAVAAGDRNFDVRQGNVDVDIDDFFSFVEVAEDDKPTGREIYRRISYVVKTKDYDFPDDEVVRHGFTVIGIIPPEFKRLQSVLASDCFVLAFAVKHEGEDNEITEFSTIPPLTVPSWLNLEQILEAVNVAVWPAGIYSVTLLMRQLEEDQLRTTIVDHLIMVKEKVDDERLLFTELDIRHLHNGQLIDLDGRKVVPTFEEDIDGPEAATSDQATLDRVTEDSDGS